jgi:hypothetical protein
LARLYPDTKFLRARAAALGFASTTSTTQVRTSGIQRLSRSNLQDRDYDDPYDEDSEANEDGVTEDGDEVDLDMLPTMLVYRDGELVHNWVRVDWEVGQAGVEELLDRLVLVLLHHFPQIFKRISIDIAYSLVLSHPQTWACPVTTRTTLILYGVTTKMTIMDSLFGHDFLRLPAIDL